MDLPDDMKLDDGEEGNKDEEDDLEADDGNVFFGDDLQMSGIGLVFPAVQLFILQFKKFVIVFL